MPTYSIRLQTIKFKGIIWGKQRNCFHSFLLHLGRIKMSNLLSPKIKVISKSFSLSREPMNLQAFCFERFYKSKYWHLLNWIWLVYKLYLSNITLFLFTSLEFYSLVLNNWICSYLPRWCHFANVPRKI